MAISLKKGDFASLGSSLQYGFIGLGWDINESKSNFDYDLDVAAFLLGRNGTVIRETDFVYYNNLMSSCGSLIHAGDNRDGSGDDDDEVIAVKFNKIPANISKITFVVNIYDAARRRQNFGQIDNAYVRFVRMNDHRDIKGVELVRYNLTSEFANDTCIVVCELVRYGTEWKFMALGEGYKKDMMFLCRKYGIDVDG